VSTPKRELGAFSRFERGTYFYIYFLLWSVPLVVIFAADFRLLKDLSPFIRYLLLAVGIVLWIPLGFIIGSWVESFFKTLRTRLGMRSFSEIEAEDLEKRSEARIANEDRERRWFTERPENEQRYSLWLLQLELVDEFKRANANLVVIKFLLVGLFIFFIAMKIF
jgi:hypothetical protein